MKIRIQITRDANPHKGNVITLDMEQYLRGVVPAEMYASDPHQALCAQAVAARTWAARRILSNQSKPYDVDDTSTCQAYRPHDRIDARTDAAVFATSGQVLTQAGKLIDAVYTNANGGRTVSAQSRWGNPIPYLIEQDDPYDTHSTREGHGVGLSQKGAVSAARQGLTCAQILAFYYPDCIIQDLPSDAHTTNYSLKREGNTHLSTNFTVREFACKDKCDIIQVDPALVLLLQNIRDHFGRAVTITSGYRTPSYNASCGGAKSSLHLTGQAADIRVSGISVRDVSRYAQSICAGGVGAYLPNRFTHIDCRTTKTTRWTQDRSGQANRYTTDLEEVL